MTDEDKTQAAAYIKLHDDVKRLIVDTIYAEMQNYSSMLHTHMQANLLHSPQFRDSVRRVVKEQMDKY
jgi:hypothetical protein